MTGPFMDVGMPVVFDDGAGLKVWGTLERIEGPKYHVVTSIGAEWDFDVYDVLEKRLQVDVRKLPENAPHIDKPVSDIDNDGPYFWLHGDIQYGSIITDKTPHWCDWHNVATSVPCPQCAAGDIL